MKRFVALYLILKLVFIQQANAQTNCKDIDLKKIPGKWNWRYQGINRAVPKQLWDICDPISKEFQRIMPQAPDGITAFALLTEGGGGAFSSTLTGIKDYENTLMIKKYECIMNPSAKVQPEGETGCWIYFKVNRYGNGFPGSNEVVYTEYPSDLYVTDIWTETDVNGNRIIFSSQEKGVANKEAYMFSPKNRLPFRKLTRKELFNCYKAFHEKRLNNEIDHYQKALNKELSEYNNLSVKEKNEQSYRQYAIDGAKKSLALFTTQKEKLINWYGSVMKQSNINDTAYTKSIVAWQFEPEPLDAKPGEGYPVWINDISFYDKSKPSSQPQAIFLSYRRQDKDVPKKNFMDKFCNEFNLDVLWKMVGVSPKKAGGINTLNSTAEDAGTKTKNQQENKGPLQYDFTNTPDGQFPSGWQGMNNIGVQTRNSNKWLVMNKPGYWFPQQFNKEIKDGFSLSFDVEWPLEIPYYGGYLNITLSEMPYDNGRQKYQSESIHQSAYKSMYSSTSGYFNRVALWFDPYWNNAGALYVYSYDSREIKLLEKTIKLPGIYKEKNKHSLTIQRKGEGLVVMDNGKEIANIAGVFQSSIRYNLYTFSRYKTGEDNDTNDVFYLKDIKAEY